MIDVVGDIGAEDIDPQDKGGVPLRRPCLVLQCVATMEDDAVATT